MSMNSQVPRAINKPITTLVLEWVLDIFLPSFLKIRCWKKIDYVNKIITHFILIFINILWLKFYLISLHILPSLNWNEYLVFFASECTFSYRFIYECVCVGVLEYICTVYTFLWDQLWLYFSGDMHLVNKTCFSLAWRSLKSSSPGQWAPGIKLTLPLFL